VFGFPEKKIERSRRIALYRLFLLPFIMQYSSRFEAGIAEGYL
jgi:hypothetical protein